MCKLYAHLYKNMGKEYQQSNNSAFRHPRIDPQSIPNHLLMQSIASPIFPRNPGFITINKTNKITNASKIGIILFFIPQSAIEEYVSLVLTYNNCLLFAAISRDNFCPATFAGCSYVSVTCSPYFQ